MKIEEFAVIGHPIAHTMSPFIHKRLFGLSGFCPSYEVLDVPDLQKCISQLRVLDGFNITIPHKLGIIPFLDELDPKAAKFASVNTIKNENGRLKGFTTDGAGCLKALVRHNADIGGDILVLGSGGAARAIAFELIDNSRSLTIAARSCDKAAALRKDLNSPKAQALSINELELKKTDYSLLINATSVGMYPISAPSPVTKELVSRCDSVFDAVYNPHETTLLKIGASLNKNVIYGIEMLVFQAVCAHEIWYGAKFSNQNVDRLCGDAVFETKRLFSVKD